LQPNTFLLSGADTGSHSYPSLLPSYQPLVVAGTADESFVAEQYEPVISQYTDVEVRLLPDVTYINVVVGPEVRPVVKPEFRKRFEKKLDFLVNSKA
jgi:hypothetical protein